MNYDGFWDQLEAKHPNIFNLVLWLMILGAFSLGFYVLSIEGFGNLVRIFFQWTVMP